MLIIDMPKKYLTDASGFVSCAMCQKYLPLLYRDCYNDFKGCLIKGEISEIELMHLEEERAFAASNIEADCTYYCVDGIMKRK